MSVNRGVRAAVLLAGLVTLARVVYLVWLSPYELTADEAQYWDWSRRLAPSYYSKGPGVAWVIAAATSVFGTSAWSIRLPAALAYGVTAVAMARLMADASVRVGDIRRASCVAALFCLAAPPFQLSALLMTIDAPYVACWSLAAWTGWRLIESLQRGTSDARWWMGLALALGAGFLFKYTIVLIVPGLATYAWLRRGEQAWDRRAARHALAAGVVLIVLVSPVVMWNVRHGWAGARHVLAQVNAPGGDRGRNERSHPYDPRWTAEYVAAQLGLFGPLIGLAAVGAARAFRHGERRERDAVVFTLSCAAPMLAACFAASLRTPIESNWPMAAFTTLAVPAGLAAVGSRAGFWARASVGYALAAATAIHAPLAAAQAPRIGRYIPVHRFTGAAKRAHGAEAVLATWRQTLSQEPLLVAVSHNAAGLLAFYLEGRPRVASAGRFFGARPSAYDFFPDTDLGSSALRNRPAFLFAGSAAAWNQALVLEGLAQPAEAELLFTARAYHGPREAPHTSHRQHAETPDLKRSRTVH